MTNRVINVTLDQIGDALKQVGAYKKNADKKIKELCRRLAEMGATQVTLGYSRAIYTGKKDIKVSVKSRNGVYRIIANGQARLFCEFGTGVTYGYGHPLAGQLGMGPGTYPEGKGHWDDPRGWHIPQSSGGGHTYGNPPNPVMYQTARGLERAIRIVAQEVFMRD